MELIELKNRPNLEQNRKWAKKLTTFKKLISELNKKELPAELVRKINPKIEALNSFSGSDNDLIKQLAKTQSKILNLVEKELKLVAKNHYRLRWMAIGMTVFGVPFGVAMGAAIHNMAFIGIGIPIGIGIGIGIGTTMDQKAFDKGKQLDLVIN